MNRTSSVTVIHAPHAFQKVSWNFIKKQKESIILYNTDKIHVKNDNFKKYLIFLFRDKTIIFDINIKIHFLETN